MQQDATSDPLVDEVIAFYLPQFHPIPENDEFWGDGFTEWTNVRSAGPLFDGHRQPVVPADLGYYDLLDPEVRAAQADLAHRFGVTAFCYWHYWFAGRQVLERPLQQVVELGEPDLPFCIGWANQSWSGVWHGAPERVLIEQTYPGDDDHRRHFDALLPTFTDRRYLRIDGRPLLFILVPRQLPEVERVLDLWRARAQAAGLGDLFIVGSSRADGWSALDHGFDGAVGFELPSNQRPRRLGRDGPRVVEYADVLKSLTPLVWDDRFPCVLPRWDNTPRSGRRGLVLRGATSARFQEQVARAAGKLASQPPGRRLLWVKSWNEWAEGNMLEPDADHGMGYLEALRDGLARPAPPVTPQAPVWRGPNSSRLKATIGDQVARFATGGSSDRVRPPDVPTPVVLCIDCEPDPRLIDPRKAPDLTGFEQTYEFFRRWRDHASEVTGAPVHLSWFIRMDAQIERCYGTTTAVVDRHPNLFDGMAEAGDAIGVHPHAFRWDDANDTWFGDFATASWLVENLDLSIDGFARTFGRPPELLRYGDGILSDEVVARAEAAGVRYDLTLEPGRRARPLAEVGEWANELQPDWRRVPREPYLPDPSDYRHRLRSGTRDIQMLPLTSGARWQGASPARRLAAIRDHGLRHRNQGDLLYMALKGWHGRNSFDRVVERSLAAQARPYLAFAVRSDRAKHTARWRRIERCLFDLLALHDRHRLAFCTPAEACTMLGVAGPAREPAAVTGTGVRDLRTRGR